MSTPEAPKFNTYEELQEWLASQSSEKPAVEGSPSKPSKESKKKATKKTASSKKKPAREDEATKVLPPDPEVWSSVHFYTRAGDNVASTRIDAKEEAKFRNDNVVVFYHDHTFGEACVAACAQV